MQQENPLLSHLRVSLAAVLCLAICQVSFETILIAARARHFVLSPHAFFGAQMYDYCLKLLLLVPGGEAWINGGVLDRFLDEGVAAKLGVAAGLLLPNAVVSLLIGTAIAAIRSGLRRRPSFGAALGLAVGMAVLVHVASLIANVYIPRSPSVRAVVRNLARVFVWEGAYLAFLGLAAAAPAAWWMGNGRRARRAAVLAIATAALVGSFMLRPDTQAMPAEPTRLSFTAGGRNGASIDNVILVSIDSLRADRLGSYGNSRDTSPTIDRLARTGTRFARVISSTSWTAPSHMSLLTGRDMLSHGLITDTDRLPDSVPTLAESLQKAGIATKGIVSAPFVSSVYGFSRGFDHYDDQTIPAPTSFDAFKDEPAPVLTDLAVKWLRENGGNRFFLFLHYWDVHYDYIPPPPYDRMFDPDYQGSITGANFIKNKAVNRNMPKRDLEHLLALYDGEIRWVDDHLARLLSALEERGLAERTAIVVTADHGDEFFEHGYKGHARTLYREVVEIPLVVRVPGAPAGRVVAEPATIGDIAPTILELMGVEGPGGMDGMTLAPAIRGERQPERSAVHSWLCSLKQRTNCQAMQLSRAGTLIHSFQPFRVEFFETGDVQQRSDLGATSKWPRTEQLSLLRMSLDARWAAYRESGGQGGTVELDDATRDRLRALGYGD